MQCNAVICIAWDGMPVPDTTIGIGHSPSCYQLCAQATMRCLTWSMTLAADERASYASFGLYASYMLLKCFSNFIFETHERPAANRYHTGRLS